MLCKKINNMLSVKCESTAPHSLVQDQMTGCSGSGTVGLRDGE